MSIVVVVREASLSKNRVNSKLEFQITTPVRPATVDCLLTPLDEEAVEYINCSMVIISPVV